MIEKMFPQTVSNILDYDAIKQAAKVYIEDVFVKVAESFGNNLMLQTMDEEHLSEISKNVTGNTSMSLEELLDYINTDNIYREFQFVDDLLSAFPEGVTYEEFDVTGWGFPKEADDLDGTAFMNASRNSNPLAFDPEWTNASPLARLLYARYKRGAYVAWTETLRPGQRSSWGSKTTWMTSGGFGKPATIHINVDSERTVIEENGLTAVENWLSTVSYKLPINLYIEINDNFNVESERFGSTDGYYMSFPYEEEETFCQQDNSIRPQVPYVPPIPPDPPVPQIYESGWMTDTEDETFAAPRGEFDMSLLELVYGGGTGLWMDEVTEKKGYLRSSAYQNSNRALSANTEYYLYPEGGDATVDGDSLKTYTLTGAYTATNVSVDITGATLLVSSGKLKLSWGATGASVCYVTYSEGI